MNNFAYFINKLDNQLAIAISSSSSANSKSDFNL